MSPGSTLCGHRRIRSLHPRGEYGCREKGLHISFFLFYGLNMAIFFLFFFLPAGGGNRLMTGRHLIVGGMAGSLAVWYLDLFSSSRTTKLSRILFILLWAGWAISTNPHPGGRARASAAAVLFMAGQWAVVAWMARRDRSFLSAPRVAFALIWSLGTVAALSPWREKVDECPPGGESPTVQLS